jgi:sucrose-6F-phosphate phosphohydrolase
MTEQWLFVSDVDDTLLGDDIALAELMTALQSASERVITAYNSSRPCASLRKSLATVPQLNPPNYLIGGLGTEIEDGASGQPLTDYTEFLGQQWQRQRIAGLMEQIGLVAHPAKYQTPLKASYDVPNSQIVAEVQQRLAAEGLRVKVIFSGGKNLDLIPAQAGKGSVIDYLRQKLDLAPEQVVVSGDSGNDVEMFVPTRGGPPYRGIVVGNADADLKRLNGEHIYHAQAACAAGVLEGLRFWNVL